MFNIDINVEEEAKTVDDVVRHLAETVSITQSLPVAKRVKEAVDMVIAYMNKEIMYHEALQNIYAIGDGFGVQGITLGAVVVGLNEIREILENG